MLLNNFPTVVSDRLRKQQRAIIQVLQQIASAAELTVLFREKKDANFLRTTRLRHLVLTESTVYCGSRAVEYSYAILLSPIQTLAANN